MWRGAVMVAVTLVHVPSTGSKSRAVLMLVPLVVVPLVPPATSTFPLVVGFADVGSRVALCSRRAPMMLAVDAHVLVAGL